MSIKEVEQELNRLAVALMESETMKEFDTLVHRYNALKLSYCRMTGEPITIASLNIEYEQLINARKWTSKI